MNLKGSNVYRNNIIGKYSTLKGSHGLANCNVIRTTNVLFKRESQASCQMLAAFAKKMLFELQKFS